MPGNDSRRVVKAIKELLDGRDPIGDQVEVMLTLDHAIASMLLVTFGGDVEKARYMLNSAVVPNVKRRLLQGKRGNVDYTRLI